MHSELSLQDIIRKLQGFWAGHGCTIWQPHGEKVGAGTMNPATFLRVLGPEPWNVGYVEPSFRADDGRYAENPNRMQMHTQYQVILKPDPGNPQELYLASLSALGLDRAKHDIRFVEDNWESPALGAWGLGWEVWLDGQEITQFTYFQQAGGQVLDPVSVEITYGLERIAMFLQGRHEVWSVDADGRHSYAELHRTHEVEHSRYNFDVASVDRLRSLHGLYQEEAEACLEEGLTHLAYDYLLRQSHNFNLLDARGAIGVTERAQFFADMRRQARRVATLHVEERERLEYPFLDEEVDASGKSEAAVGPALQGGAEAVGGTLLLEIGMEELPPNEVTSGLRQLRELVPAMLADHRLSHGAVTVNGTPRRFAIQVAALAPRQADEETVRRGPSLKVAFDSFGEPTKAAAGFARSCGVTTKDLEKRDGYVYARGRNTGKDALRVLPQALQACLDGLQWGRPMRWNSSGKSFPRPVRWLLALFGSTLIPFDWGGLRSGSWTRGPRYEEARRQDEDGSVQLLAVRDCKDYGRQLADLGVILDRDERRAEVLRLVQKAAANLKGAVSPDENLLDEVTDLVEAPRALAGTFPREYLSLPAPVLKTVMRKHQRYFPVVDMEGHDRLLPHFITVVNGLDSQEPAAIRAGNESVVIARFADAAFFVDRDMATSLREMRDRLRTLTFHAQLGTMWDKVERLTAAAPRMADLLGLQAEEARTCRRAAELCKLDLVMQMVVEMTSLQGTMMAHYAEAHGEPELVCAAVREHYLPRFAGDAAPATRAGLALSVCDRLDSLVGLMAAGVRARGNADPFGLRRLGLGLLANLLQSDTSLNLRAAVAMAAELHAVDVTAETQEEVLQFLTRRLTILMREQDLPLDVVEAVTGRIGADPVHAMHNARQLAQAAGDQTWHDPLQAYVRCARIVPSDFPAEQEGGSELVEQVERDLEQGVCDAAAHLRQDTVTVDRFREAMIPLAPLIDRFFEEVMVMTDDPGLRASRLQLMARVRQLGMPLGDLTRLQT